MQIINNSDVAKRLSVDKDIQSIKKGMFYHYLLGLKAIGSGIKGNINLFQLPSAAGAAAIVGGGSRRIKKARKSRKLRKSRKSRKLRKSRKSLKLRKSRRSSKRSNKQRRRLSKKLVKRSRK